ncbi:hypothetical protein ElyMa_004656500 [Elysia marginata]|uniref:DUF6451 domain-containing protein n=1 Tax=Elysia marginata TaxID=1093978 RepID=A0AAV4I1W5_9GAST|nr:hypothetical protein ElyMa_004656500 [Elysia marginata]
MEVSNRFYALETLGDVEDIEDYWNKIKEVWKEAGKRVKTNNNRQVTVEDEELENVDGFTYLGGTINKEGGVEEDIKKRIQKARQAFLGLKKIWSTKIIKERKKIKIFNSNVRAVLFFGAKTWRTNKTTIQKLQSFGNRCMRSISIHWQEIISNIDLWERTQQQPMEVKISRRKWRWIGHTLRKSRQCITRHNLAWNPQGCRVRGRPRMTWRRDTEAEMASAEKTWKEPKEIPQTRMVSRTFVGGLCFPGS